MTKISTKNFLVLSMMAFICASTQLKAQDNAKENAPSTLIENKNLVKMNVGALLLKNYSFQYERLISKRISVAVGVRLSPKSNVPFSSKIETLIDDPETWESIKNFKTGNFAITPEVRLYMGKGVFNGFYVAPFARYAKYTAEVPVSYDGDNGSEMIPLDGDVTTLTGGLLLGAQWKLSKLVYLDWWILGPNYGSSSGTLTGTKNLSATEQAEIKETLDDLMEDLNDTNVIKASSTVSSNGAKINFDGPWAGLRAGLCIGFRF